MVGNGWCILAAGADALAALTPAHWHRWATLGGNVAHLAGPTEVGGLQDLDGTYTHWFEANPCCAVVVRPDWYVYGLAEDAEALPGLLDGLEGALRHGPRNVLGRVA